MTNSLSKYLPLIDQFDLQPNSILFIASDSSNLAKYFKEEGSPFDVNEFIEFLQEFLSEGTLIFPAYTDLLRNNETFDYAKSVPTTGAISKRVGRRKDFKRTADPLHSVYVWGAKQQEICELDAKSTFGEDSIFGYLNRNHAKMLIIDVHFQNSFTFIHYIEEQLNVAYRRYFNYRFIVLKDGKSYVKPLLFHTKKMGVETDLFELQKDLIQNNYIQEANVFGAKLLFLDFSATKLHCENFLKNGGKLYKWKARLFFKQLIKKIINRK